MNSRGIHDQEEEWNPGGVMKYAKCSQGPQTNSLHVAARAELVIGWQIKAL